MHNQLINTLCGGSHRHHTGASFPGLDCFELGSNPRVWPHCWCQIVQIVSSKSHSQTLPTLSANLPCSCTTSLRCRSFFRCSASFSSPPGHQTSGLLLYWTIILVKGLIRQTWPNKHHSCCQLDDYPLQLPLQVALNFIRSIRTSVRGEEGFPHSHNPIHVSPMGMAISFC
jgi:hypothetical protein